ncbi:MAG: hypothetical protein AAFO89_06405 [Planctomycetota bacterium]
MAKFRFKLEPVLRQRQVAERDEQLRVAEIERERLAGEARLREQQLRIEAEECALTEMTIGGRTDAGSIRWQGIALAAAKAEAERMAQHLGTVLRRLEQARDVLASKAGERRAIELLKERQRVAFKRAEDAAEIRMLDDLASAAAVRRVAEIDE